MIRNIFIRYLYIFPFVLSLLSTNAYSQYTIPFSEYPQIGTTNAYFADTTGGIPVTLGSSGENQSWNFTQDLLGMEFQSEYALPNASPYYSDLLQDAQWAYMSKQWLTFDLRPLIPIPYRGFFDLDFFERADNDTVYGMGVGFQYPPIINSGYILEEEQINFPLPIEYGKEWERQFEISDQFSIASPPDTLQGYFVYKDSSIVVVDGLGELAIPFGTFQCLRLKINRYLIIDLYILLAGDYRRFTLQYSFLIYEWHTKNAGMLLQVISHEGETNDNFSDASLVVRLTSSNAITGIDNEPCCPLPPSTPEEFSLVQNFPNPFNPSTTIKYNLAQTSHVHLDIYNIRGQKVRTLVNEHTLAGNHTISWNGLDDSGIRLPAGIYICRISTDSFVYSIKMALVN